MMNNRFVVETLRYKDRGHVQYRIIEGFDNEQDCLELKYTDDEKSYTWEYYFADDHKSTLDHLQSISYEALKA